ncbi:DUF72 domain-containing protein [Opitutus terrae]|uniref:DUF72 domain-containing protein n=1 Tax=Opitutus terrae (strain DSM 11246 / JCM 15787 / PB90-1) TaxID=452637 RepID=B1ZWK1_OPITP|nr:DUF72 domain-containing protein [Opitutus terrae]ACB73325.1 protein of unknown function DUF72 [Opitutus terrae PB90-1]
MADTRIGISGWTYAPWRGTFFPAGLSRGRELAYAAAQVRTIEINGTFYSMQRPSSFAAWRAETPDDFVFAIKGPRFVTHMKQLNDVVAPLGNFFASGVLRLGPKLGPLLWQLPPRMRFNPERLARFFDVLPRTQREAALLGRHHDHRLKARAWLRVERDQPLRHALEVRHDSFMTDEFITLLRRHDIGLVVADTAGKWPRLGDVTADFVYVRLHGDTELYASGYTQEALQTWAARIRAWSAGKDISDLPRVGASAARRPAGRDVFVYFDNDVKTHAPFDAMTLAHELGLGPPAPAGPLPGTGRVEAVRTTWAAWRSPRVAARRTRRPTSQRSMITLNERT